MSGQRPSQFTIFSNTAPHKHSPLRRITARMRAHFDSSDTDARPPEPLRRAPFEAGPHELWMGSRVAPRPGLRTPVPLAAVGRTHHAAVPRAHAECEPNGDTANGSFVVLDKRPEWTLRNGRRHLVSAVPYPIDYSPESLASHALGNLLSPDAMAPIAPRRCLDVGCGGGEWIRSALRRWPACQFVGLDIVLLNRAQLRKHPDSRVSWVKADFLERLPFPSASFDHVHLRDVARAVPAHAWASLLAEIGRILEPGGRVDITADDIIFPVLPRSLTARPSSAEIATHSGTLESRGRSDETIRDPDDKPRSRSRLRGTFSDGEGSVRVNIGRILRVPRRSTINTERKSSQALFIPCVSGAALQTPVCEPRVSSDEQRALGVPSFGFAMSSPAFGSVLSLRSTDGSIPARTSAVSLHPPAHTSVASFQGPLSPPLTPPRRELAVPEVPEEDTRPSLGHDYELLEELFYAVYNRRDVHLQLTSALPAMIQATGIFDVQAHDPIAASMPACRVQRQDAPPTPEMSPKSGNPCREADVRAALHLKYALQGILGVREAMWEELVLRRDLADSPDERVRHERVLFEDMVASYARAVEALIDVPSKLVSCVGWRRPVPREQTLEQKWVASESQRLRDAWATREAIHGLAGYSTFSRRTRTIIAVKA